MASEIGLQDGKNLQDGLHKQKPSGVVFAVPSIRALGPSVLLFVIAERIEHC